MMRFQLSMRFFYERDLNAVMVICVGGRQALTRSLLMASMKRGFRARWIGCYKINLATLIRTRIQDYPPTLPLLPHKKTPFSKTR